MSTDLEGLFRQHVTPPTRQLDTAGVVRQARRRRRGVRVASALGGVAVLGLVGVGVLLVTDGVRPPLVVEQPPAEVDWLTLVAGDLAISVPPDWGIDYREAGEQASTEFEDGQVPGYGGPCEYDLYVGDNPESPYEGPAAVVYPQPGSGICAAAGLPPGPPADPAVVLFETIGAGEERRQARQHGEQARIGSVDVWRESRSSESLRYDVYVPVDHSGGLWVSHVDDPTVQAILDTARTATSEDRDAYADQPRPDHEPDQPPGQTRPDLMTITPQQAAPSEIVEVHFPEGTERSVGYTLERRVEDGWELAFYLTTVHEGSGPRPTWNYVDRVDHPEWPWIDLDGPGPDELVIPNEPLPEPGQYRICTGRTPHQPLCAEITITGEVS